MYCDLHNHSLFSDGTDTPEELIRQAEALGLDALALTDHNSAAGLPRFLAAAEGSAVEAVPGIEFSTGYRGSDLHILALFVRPCHYDAVRALAEIPDRLKRESNLALAEKLNRAGYVFDYAAVEASTPDGRVNRANIARELARLGYVADVDEAFRKLLKKRHGFYTPPERLDALETVGFIRSIGAVCVLAHPWLNLKTQPELEEFLNQAVPLGLDGMEVRYSKFTPEESNLGLEIAKRYGILPSGGSDYHGEAVKPGIAMGTGRGDLRVPTEWYQALKSLAESRRCAAGVNASLVDCG